VIVPQSTGGGQASAARRPFGDQPIVFGLRFLAAVTAQVVVATVQRDDVLACGFMFAIAREKVWI